MDLGYRGVQGGLFSLQVCIGNVWDEYMSSNLQRPVSSIAWGTWASSLGAEPRRAPLSPATTKKQVATDQGFEWGIIRV